MSSKALSQTGSRPSTVRLASLWVFLTSLIIVGSSRLVFFYSTVAESVPTSVFSFVGISIVVDPVLLFIVMYALSPRVGIESNYVRISLGLLAAGIVGEGIAAWLFGALIQSNLNYSFPNIASYAYIGIYTFAVGFSAIAFSFFRRAAEVTAATVSTIDAGTVRTARGRLLDFASFAFAVASIAIAIKLTTFIGQTVVFDPINYGDSVIMVITALLLIYRLR